VPTDRIGDLQLVSQDWLEIDPVNRTRPVRLPSLCRRTGEYPILRLVVGATCAPCEQNLRHFGTDGNRLSRSLRLAAFDPLLDYIADDAKFETLEIDIFPFQAKQFADPKTSGSSKRHSRSRKIINQALQKELDLFRRKDRWDSGTLGTLTDMANRIGAYPLREIWHDDKFTYLRGQFQETPALYEVKDGKPSLINFDFSDGLYTVPKELDNGYLAIGKKKVTFHRVEGGN
jgi:hypothetical protein